MQHANHSSVVGIVRGLVLALVAFCGASRGAERPNVILFLIDDQDRESLGCYGGKTYTPNLDRMAAEGMKFTRAYVSSAICTPSRYSWATGRFAGTSTSKLYDEDCGGPDMQGFPNFNMALEPDRMNLGNALREGGYATGWVGKFHLASEVDFPEYFQGEDEFRDVPRKNLTADAATSALFAHNEAVLRRYITNLGFSWAKHVYFENMHPPFSMHNPEWTTEAALEFIEENKGKPFYLHCCPTLLHGQIKSAQRSMDYPLISGEGELKSPPQAEMTPRDELLKRVEAAGFELTDQIVGEAWIDDAIGTILRKVKELGLDEKTMVVFCPDHGRRGKSSLFSQDGVNIPLIARQPGTIPAGVVCEELVENVDWAPTVLDAAGVAKPAGYRMDGRSFLPLLKQTPGAVGRDHVYLEMGYARAVATKDWKYIAVRYPQEQIDAIRKAQPAKLPGLMSYIGREGIGIRGAERSGFWDPDQLYDLNSDPDERINLAADPKHAPQLQTMKALLTADLKTMTRPFGEFVPGGNAAPTGQIDKQIAQVKKITIDGKKITVPEEVEKEAPPQVPSRAEERAARKAKRLSRRPTDDKSDDKKK